MRKPEGTFFNKFGYNNKNSNDFNITNLVKNNTTLLLQIKLQNGVIVNEKVETLVNTMDISNFNSGLYSVKIESAGKVFYSKFIKL